MKNTFLKTTVGTFLALLMLFGCTQFFVSGQETETSDSLEEQTERSQRNIVGAWRTVVTPRSCQTGLPVARDSRGLFTFNEGGTLSEYNSPGPNPGVRSPAHGVWERKNGLQQNLFSPIKQYSFVFVVNRYDASGGLISTQTVRAALELSASGNSYTTNASFEILDANDNLIATGCATGVGTRIE